MADAFFARGAYGGVRDHGVFVTVPAMPIWAPEQAVAVVHGLLVDTMRLALQFIAGSVSAQAPVDSGALAQSFGSDPANVTGGIELTGGTVVEDITGRVFSSLPQAIVMDQGRRPGAPISREGIDAIGLWAQRKLGLTAEQAEQAKWPIAMAIVQRGIEGRYYIEAGVTMALPTVNEMFTALADAVAAELTALGGGR